jgi:hypothetical protein
MHSQLFNLLTAKYDILSQCKFHAHHIKHPKSGDQILLVGAPNPHYEQVRAAGEGLNHILTHG